MSPLTKRLTALIWWLALGYLTWMLLDWALIKAVFRPDEAACRALEHTGACWGVITEKIRPLLFGAYPYEEQSRPAIAMVVMLGASAALLWAPTLWSTRRFASCLLIAGTLVGVLMRGGVFGLTQVNPEQWGGLPLTLILAWLTMLLSVPLGLLLAMGRKSSKAVLRMGCTCAIEVSRGVPLVMVLFMAAFMLPSLLPEHNTPGLLWRVTIAMSLFSAAYIAEIVRGGLQTVGQDQIDAAKVLGLTHWQTQRLIVLPQALRVVLPALVSHAIGLLKDTSLIMAVSLHELTGSLSLSLGGDPIWRPYYFEGYLFVAAVYATMCLSLSSAGRRLEQRWLAASVQQ